MAKKQPKVRRIVLGTGHPWYSSAGQSGVYDTIQLTKKPVSASILARGGAMTVELNKKDTGNYNKVRLVLEIIE